MYFKENTPRCPLFESVWHFTLWAKSLNFKMKHTDASTIDKVILIKRTLFIAPVSVCFLLKFRLFAPRGKCHTDSSLIGKRLSMTLR